MSPVCVPPWLRKQEQQIMANSSQHTPVLERTPSKAERPNQEHLGAGTDKGALLQALACRGAHREQQAPGNPPWGLPSGSGLRSLTPSSPAATCQLQLHLELCLVHLPEACSLPLLLVLSRESVLPFVLMLPAPQPRCL